MKKLFIFLIAGFSFLSFSHTPDDVFSQLGITEKQAQETIWKSFEKSSVYFPPGFHTRRAGLKAIGLQSRRQLLRGLGAYIKQYVASEAFSKQYGEYRVKHLPPPPSKPDVVLTRVENMNRKNLKEAEEGLKTAKTAEDREHYQTLIEFWKKQMEPYKDHNSPEYARQKKNAQGLYDLVSSAHQNKIKQFDEKFPPGAMNMVRLRLEAFLAMSGTIDFNAVVKYDDYSKRMLFVNPAYEQKPYEWKFCYRLGKETVEELRAFTREWLKELKQ